MVNLCCCQRQLAWYPASTCQPLMLQQRRKIVGNNIVTIRNKETFPWQHVIVVANSDLLLVVKLACNMQ